MKQFNEFHYHEPHLGYMIVMAVVLVFGEDVPRLFCGNDLQSGSLEEKLFFMMS